MPTKKTAAPGKRATVKKATAPAKPSSSSPTPARVHVHPAKVEFFAAGETEPYSRMPNGAAGSDANAAVQAAMEDLDVTVKHFDVQGRPVEEDDEPANK